MIKHFFNATKYALQGLSAMLRKELAFQCECVLLIFLIPLAVWLGPTPLSRAMLIAVLFLVLIVEALNTSLEAVVDRIGSERHALSGLAKDVAASAVFLSIVNAIAVWAIILLG